MEQEHPFVSIIIPTYDRPRRLKLCLQSIARLEYPRTRFEVLVLDDGSPTPPEAIVAPFRREFTVTLLAQARAGPAAARNAAAAKAKGALLAFTDDDCRPDANWLQALATRSASAPDCAVGGRTLNALSGNPCAAASQLIIKLVYAHYNANPKRARFFASQNLAVPAEQFRMLSGFDAASFPFASEDRDFCDRWLQSGLQMVYAPEAVVYHAHDLTLGSFWRQHFEYGRGAFRFHRARARRGSGRFVRDLSFHLNLPRLLRRSFPRVDPPRAMSLAALLVIWQVANAAGFAYESLNQFHSRRGRDASSTLSR
jgi:GT2 family glycosyltransferase